MYYFRIPAGSTRFDLLGGSIGGFRFSNSSSESGRRNKKHKEEKGEEGRGRERKGEEGRGEI